MHSIATTFILFYIMISWQIFAAIQMAFVARRAPFPTAGARSARAFVIHVGTHYIVYIMVVLFLNVPRAEPRTAEPLLRLSVPVKMALVLSCFRSWLIWRFFHSVSLAFPLQPESAYLRVARCYNLRCFCLPRYNSHFKAGMHSCDVPCRSDPSMEKKAKRKSVRAPNTIELVLENCKTDCRYHWTGESTGKRWRRWRRRRQQKPSKMVGKSMSTALKSKFRLNHFLVAAGAIVPMAMHHNTRKFVAYQLLLIIDGSSHFECSPTSSDRLAAYWYTPLYAASQSELIMANIFGSMHTRARCCC